MNESIIKHRKLFDLDKKTFPSMFSNMTYNILGENLKKLYQGQLHEGFYRTYPIENVVKYIEQLFGDTILDSDAEQKGNSYLISFTIPKNIDSTILDKAMSLCGYYINNDGRKNVPYIKIAYAPRYSDEKTNIFNSYIMYHQRVQLLIIQKLTSKIIKRNNTLIYPKYSFILFIIAK